MASARNLFLTVALAPLPLTVTILAFDSSVIRDDILRNSLFSAIGASFYLAAFAALLYIGKPQYLFTRGSDMWLGLSFIGSLAFLLGSFLGLTFLHVTGLGIGYVGMVAYLAGPRIAEYIAAGAFLLTLIFLPTIVSGPLLFAMGSVLAIATCIILIVLVRTRFVPSEDCSRCDSYRRTGARFCFACGKVLFMPISFTPPWKKLAVVAILSVLVVTIVLPTSLPVPSVSSSGVVISNFKFDGPGGVLRLPAINGWTSRLIGSGGNQTFAIFSYALEGPQKANATVVLSGPLNQGISSALKQYVNLQVIGTASLPSGQEEVFYDWTQHSENFSGILLVSPLTYLSSGVVFSSHAIFFFSEANPQSVPLTSISIYSLAGNIASQLQGLSLGTIALLDLVGPATGGSAYLIFIAVGSLIAVIAGIARSEDLSAAKFQDNASGLDPIEFSTLAEIASVKKGGTGSLLIQRASGQEWAVFSAILGRLERSGLVRRKIEVRRGNPTAIWLSRLTV